MTNGTLALGGVEALFNLNREANALDPGSGSAPNRGVSAFHDTRVGGQLGLTTTLFALLSVAFGFTLRYEQTPAPGPLAWQAVKSHVYADLCAIRRRGRHHRRGAPHLHVHLSRFGGSGPSRAPFLTSVKRTHYLYRVNAKRLRHTVTLSSKKQPQGEHQAHEEG
jgi:hypothetical protein